MSQEGSGYIHVQGESVSRTPPDAARLSQRDPNGAPAQDAKVEAPRGKVSIQHTGTGEVIIKQLGPSGLQTGLPATSSDDVLSTGRNAFGPVGRDAINEETILDHPALGGSARVKELLAMGVLVKDAATGYKFVGFDGQGEQEQTPEAKKDEEKKPEDQPQADPGIVEASPEVEAAISEAFTKAGNEAVASTFDAAMSGDGAALDSAIQTIAEKSGTDADTMRARVEKVWDALAAQAEKASGLDADDWQACCEWARANNMEAVQKADRALFLTGQTRQYKGLAELWTKAGKPSSTSAAAPATPQTLDDAENDDAPLTAQAVMALSRDELRAATLGAGLSLRFDGSGRVMVSSKEWSGEVELRSAVRAGLLVIRG